MSSEEVDLADSHNVGSEPVTQSAPADGLALRMRGTRQGVLVLLAVALIVWLGVGYFGYSKYELPGVITAGVAGLLCFTAASAALIVTALTANSPNALSGILLGIVLRTAVPLLLTILLMQAFKPLADTGLMGMVLINYLAVLAAETLLAVRIVQANSSTVVQQ